MALKEKPLPVIQDVMVRDLWSYEDCAVYLQVQSATIKDKYSRFESWPARRGGGELGKPMYKACEVKAWAMCRAI